MLKYHIQTIEVGSGGSSAIVFNNIPQDASDLLLVVSARTDRASVTDDIKIEFNGVNTNQSVRVLFGNGATASSATDTLIYGWTNGNSATSNTFGNTQFYIPNYTSNLAKSVSIDAVNEGNQTTQYQGIYAGLWNSTAAITSIALKPYVGPNFVSGSTASLYKIKRGDDGVVNYPATGGTITTSGGYTYHTFTASGTFVAKKTFAAEVLIVSGGASGIQASGLPSAGAGGGGGGSTVTSTTVSTGNINVVVGGSDSQSYFGALTVTAGSGQTPGLNGGAGGNGGSSGSTQGGANGNNISGLGWAVGPTQPGGGGGGGNSTGTGASPGGTQGGGQGATGFGGYSSAGAANTGGGGGGSAKNDWDRPSSPGGSGIVIIRYPTPA